MAVTVEVLPTSFDGRAASDDEGGRSAAQAATSPVARTDHLACADVAGGGTGKEAKPRVLSECEKMPKETEDLPGGVEKLPEDHYDFAEAVHARVDLVRAWVRLVRSADEKVSQRALEKLDEMKYAGDSDGDEPRQMEILVPPRIRPLATN